MLGRVRAALGLDRVRAVISGAAPIGTGTVLFFASLGLRIHEGYGMSEGGIFTGGVYQRPRPGTVGRPLPGVELRLADDGEIQARTPAAMTGYLDDPAATAERIDADGWIHTGDLGAFDPDGLLRVVGRKKELIVTAGGKKVAPEEVEGLLRGLPAVAQAMVVGDRRPFLVALLTLDPVGGAGVRRGARHRGRDARRARRRRALPRPPRRGARAALQRPSRPLPAGQALRGAGERVLDRDRRADADAQAAAEPDPRAPRRPHRSALRDRSGLIAPLSPPTRDGAARA